NNSNNSSNNTAIPNNGITDNGSSQVNQHTETQLNGQLNFDPMEIDFNQIAEQLTDEELAALIQDDLNFTLTAEELGILKQTMEGDSQQTQQQQQTQENLTAANIDAQLAGVAKDLALDEATHHALRQLVQALEHNPNLIERCINGQLDLSSL